MRTVTITRLDKFNVAYDIDQNSIVYTTIVIALDGRFVGFMIIANSIKADAGFTIQLLHKLGVKATMPSGDKRRYSRMLPGSST
jgi:Cation transport ATPase